MNHYMLKKPLSKNQLDDLTDGLVNAMKYCDPSVLYPSDLEKAKPNDGVDPEWFLPIYNGSNSFSELSAIMMYTTQEAQFEEVGELMLGIGLTEMKHYGKLGEFIRAIGGDITDAYNSEESVIGSTPEGAIDQALKGEKETIKFYDELSDKISKVEETETTRIALQFISKLRADEVVHVKLLNERKKNGFQ